MGIFRFHSILCQFLLLKVDNSSDAASYFFTIAALSGLMQVQYVYFISTVRCCNTVLKLVRKTMLMQNFWGQTRCVRDNAELSADEDSSNFVYQLL